MTDPTRRNLILTAAGAALALPFLGALPALAQTALSRSAPPPRPARAVLPLYHDRAVGRMTLTTICDGQFELTRDMVVNLEGGAYRAALTEAYLDPEQPMRLPVSAHLLRQGDRLTLIDAGAGAAFGEAAGRLAGSLAALDIAPERIDRVVMTHLHPDHAGGLVTPAGAAFPNATLHLHHDELAFWTDVQAAGTAPEPMRPQFALAREVVEAYGPRIQTFGDQDDLGGGVTVMALPGHTPGHSGLRLSDGDAQMVVIGDAASMAALQFRHPDAGIAFDVDAPRAAVTRRDLLQMVTADRIAVAGTHLPFPGIGHVEARGDAFAWVPEDWFATRA